MQNPWFPLYVADYLAKTSHLSQAQHGAYMLLMMHYYATGKPIHACAMQVHSICRCTTDAERDAASTVLSMFFEKEGDFYRHPRIDEELENRSNLREIKQKAARKRWDAGAMHMHTQSQSHTQSHKKESKAKAASAFEIPEWVPRESWSHYEEMRRKIRKPMTDVARKWAVEALEKLRVKGFDPAEVLEQSVFNSWQGLFEVKNDSNTQSGRDSRQQPGTQVQRAINNTHAILDAFPEVVGTRRTDSSGQASRSGIRNPPILEAETGKV